MVMPTVVDFANDFDNNENWLGRAIRPENPYGDYGPQSYKEYNASGASRAVARGLNTATGGSPLESGVVDISPEYIDHFFSFMGGGAGRFAGRVVGLGERALEGTLSETEAYEVPILRVLRTETGDYVDQNRYFDFIDTVKEARAQQKLSEGTGYPMTKRMVDLTKLWGQVRAAEKQRKLLSGKMDVIYADDKLSNKMRNLKLRTLKKARAETYTKFNRAYITQMGKQAE